MKEKVNVRPLPWDEVELTPDELLQMGISHHRQQVSKATGQISGPFAGLIRMVQSGAIRIKDLKTHTMPGEKVAAMLQVMSGPKLLETTGINPYTSYNWRKRGARRRSGAAQLCWAIHDLGLLDTDGSAGESPANRIRGDVPTGDDLFFFGEEPGFARLYITGTYYYIGPVHQTEADAAQCSDESRRRINRRVVRTIGERRYIDLPDQTVGLVEVPR